MKKWILVLLLVVVAVPVVGANAVTWQQLAGCLPDVNEIDGFIREPAEGENSPEAWASVNYARAGKGDISEDETDYGLTISVMISDCVGIPDYLESMMEMSDMDAPASINGRYRGKKTLAQNESGIYGCRYTFAVNNRFLVEIGSSGKADLFAQMDRLIAAMNLRGLESYE